MERKKGYENRIMRETDREGKMAMVRGGESLFDGRFLGGFGSFQL